MDWVVIENEQGTELDGYQVPGLERGIRLLTLFSQEEPELSAAEITRRLGLPHATVYRILRTLESCGLLRRSDRRYALGPRILTLGYQYLSTQSVVDVARPELERLRDRTGMAANIGVLDERSVVYIAHVPSLRPIGTRMQIGARLSAHTSSMGRVLLGALASDELSKLYHGVKFQPSDSETVGSLADLKAQLARDREAGYVVNYGFYDERGYYQYGLVAIAAPLFDHTRKVVAAVNVSGPSDSVPAEDARGFIKDELCAAAKRISRLLGAPDQR